MPLAAVPVSASAYPTVTRLPLPALSVTVNVNDGVAPTVPSGTLGDEIDSVGAPSSSVIVPVPLPAAIVAFVAPLSLTATVSSDSSVVSPLTDTAMLRLVTPAANVSVPAATAV